jgi:hypothetical protein
MYEITDERLQRVSYLHHVSGLDIRMWNDPKQQANVYVFFDDGREVLRMFGYQKAKVFAKGVEYGRQNPYKMKKRVYRREIPSKLEQLEIELSAVEAAIDNAVFRVESKDLYGRRAELLGQIKEATS